MLLGDCTWSMERWFYRLRISFIGQQSFTRNCRSQRADIRRPKQYVRAVFHEEVTSLFICLEKSPSRAADVDTSPNREPKRRSSTEDQSEISSMTTRLRDISPSKRRFYALPTPSDLKRAIQHNGVTQNVTIDMKYLLRFPIEVWVSSGEAFVQPPRKCL